MVKKTDQKHSEDLPHFPPQFRRTRALWRSLKFAQQQGVHYISQGTRSFGSRIFVARASFPMAYTFVHRQVCACAEENSVTSAGGRGPEHRCARRWQYGRWRKRAPRALGGTKQSSCWGCARGRCKGRRVWQYNPAPLMCDFICLGHFSSQWTCSGSNESLLCPSFPRYGWANRGVREGEREGWGDGGRKCPGRRASERD